MSFGSSGFGGFGSNSQSGFGGGGFGTTNTSSGFGQQNSTGFGTGTNNTTSSFGGFGTSNSGFGASKPAFGSAASTGSMFGSTTATTGGGFGGGGFGSNTNNTSAFGGSGSTGSGLFGNKQSTTFGGSSGNSPFGGGGSATFGSNNASSSNPFGGSVGTALGGNVPESQGTASTPYQAFTEKEPNSSGTNNFQSITFQQPYSKYSFEELRMGDYNAGRRFANASGQAGAFGTSTGFGGFGGQNNQSQGTGFGNNASSGIFGNTTNNTSSGGFATGTATSGGFGGGGFGQKPTGSTLFGAATTGAQSSGGIFGSASGSGFGQQNNGPFGSTQNSGGLFGQNNQQKSGGLFGSTNNASNPFGTSNQASGFGSGGGSSIFGQQSQGQNQGTSGFGNQQQQNSSNPFQSSTGTGFGSLGNSANTQQKSTGLFSNSNPNSIFGNNQQNNQQPSGGIFGGNTSNTGNTGTFGNANSNNQTNTLFAPKPANANPLFGNTQQNQQNTGNSLFGQTQNQAPGLSLFNNAQQKPLGNPGTSLFPNNQQQPQNNLSLFNNSATNQNQGSSLLGNSLLGSQQNNLQPPQGLTASINDPNPYGSVSIFNGLPPPPQANPGPIATPIQSGQKQRKPAVLPQYRLNPAMSPRFATPQRRGYGFSYSTYGTPTGALSSASTPGGLSSSLPGGSINRSLGKSFSTSNLRKTYDADGDSILAPGAFSATGSRFSQQGSMKRLTIDRTLRSDLFGSNALAALPSTDTNDSNNQSLQRKKVSFDSTIVASNVNGNRDINGMAEAGGASANSTTNGELSPTPTAQEQGFLRSSSRVNLFSGKTNGNRRSLGSLQPEMSQVKGGELAIVHEDSSADAADNISTALARQDRSDPVPGNYWCRPPMAELKKMSREQLKSLPGFEVGRAGCGSCRFLENVDLTTVNLDQFYGYIAEIHIRSVTIYPNNANKPPVGSGLNVPSEITLENSWARARNKRDIIFETSGPAIEKHIRRLREVRGTEFVSYDISEGLWTFRVPHFTTYALDYEDDEAEVDSSALSVVSNDPPTPTPLIKKFRAGSTPGPKQSGISDSSMMTDSVVQASSELEDTFEFKKRRVPGGFEEELVFNDNEPEMKGVQEDRRPFLGNRSAALQSDDEDEPSEVGDDDAMEDQALVVRDGNEDDDMVVDMIGSFPKDNASKSVLGTDNYEWTTPRKAKLILEDDWADQLQKTISPRKRDRQALKENQAHLFNDTDLDLHAYQFTKKSTMDSGEITNSIDLMKSLFGKEETRKSVRGDGKQVARKGFQWPYPKRSGADQPEMDEVEREFHDSFKPSWGYGNLLVHAADDSMAGRLEHVPKPPMEMVGSLASERRDICLSKISPPEELLRRGYEKQLQRTEISLQGGVPVARAIRTSFGALDKRSCPQEERLIWELANILFDNFEDDFSEGIPAAKKLKYRDRVRKDRLSAFWSQLCQAKALAAVSCAQGAEERAIAYLSMNMVVEACNALSEARDHRLATLIAQIGGDQIMHEDMAEQISSWKQLNVLSEMSEPVRALYEMLAGNVCFCEGKKGAVEDRVPGFTLSERFKLDWARAFGLRLWYSILDGEPIESAVQKYLDDLEGKETARPKPWFLEKEGDSPSWSDPTASEREDVLWGLLKLYGEDALGRVDTSLSDVVAPRNVKGSPMDSRLSFELYHALSPALPDRTSPYDADELAISFASELKSANLWLWAIFVLLHLSKDRERQAAIQDLLARQAPIIDVANKTLLDILFDTFKIPSAWVYEAKAIYARAVLLDPLAEVHFLQKAGDWTEAHRVLCAIVAPRAIVERDHDTLAAILKEFEAAGETPHEWRSGGGVYADYLALLGSRDKDEKQRLLGRLLRTLPELAGQKKAKHKHKGQPEKTAESEGFLQGVAAREMGWVVGDMVLADKENERDHALTLQLPLTREMRLDRSRELGLEYYRKVMAAG